MSNEANTTMQNTMHSISSDTLQYPNYSIEGIEDTFNINTDTPITSLSISQSVAMLDIPPMDLGQPFFPVPCVEASTSHKRQFASNIGTAASRGTFSQHQEKECLFHPPSPQLTPQDKKNIKTCLKSTAKKRTIGRPKKVCFTDESPPRVKAAKANVPNYGAFRVRHYAQSAKSPRIRKGIHVFEPHSVTWGPAPYQHRRTRSNLTSVRNST
jgi:hypothetical protein